MRVIDHGQEVHTSNSYVPVSYVEGFIVKTYIQLCDRTKAYIPLVNHKLPPIKHAFNCATEPKLIP